MEKRALAIKTAIFEHMVAIGLLKKHVRNERPCQQVAYIGCRDPRCHMEHGTYLSRKHELVPVNYPLFGGGFRLSEHSPVDTGFWETIMAMVYPGATFDQATIAERDHRHRDQTIEALASGVLLLGHDLVNLDVHGPKCAWAAMHGVGLHQQLWYNHGARRRLERVTEDGRWLRVAQEYGREFKVTRMVFYETLHWHYDRHTGHDDELHTTWRVEPDHALFGGLSMAAVGSMNEEQFLSMLMPNHPALITTGQEVPSA